MGLTITAILLLGPPAWGDTFVDGEIGDADDGTIEASVSATYEIHDAADGVVASYAGSAGGPVIVCYYYAPAPVEGGGVAGPDMAPGPVWPPVDGEPYFLYCYDADGVWVSGALVTFDAADPLGPVASVERSRDLALERIALPAPTPALSPPADRPHLVGAPSWYALATAWAPVTASATLGGVTSTVTATPATTTWDPGDGTPLVTCAGPGETWRPDGPDEPPCGHTYTTGGRPVLVVTITWEVTWSATTGDGGPLGPLTTANAVPLDVRPAQAVVR